MYATIDNELGLPTIKYCLEKYLDIIPRNITKAFILEGMLLVVGNNTFTFDNQNYLQIRGTGMGTKMEPTYATLVMGFLEIKLYEEIGKRYNNQVKKQFVDNWWRYLDDCFIIWDKESDTVENLAEILQTLHINTKLTVESSNKELTFLDIKIIIEKKDIITDLYQKPTDSQQYVLFTSCHPSHIKRNMPLILSRRACTVIEKNKRKQEQLEKLKVILLKQGYPNGLIQYRINKALTIPQEDLRLPKEQSAKKETVTLVTTHNPRNPDVYKIIKDTIAILRASPKMRKH